MPASSTMAVPHGAAGVGSARRRLRAELLACAVPASLIEDALLVLSELLSNSGRHARPLYGASGTSAAFVRADWHRAATGELTLSVTDGGGPTRPRPATPSITARGGRGLTIITTLADDWGVRDGDSNEWPSDGRDGRSTEPAGEGVARGGASGTSAVCRAVSGARTTGASDAAERAAGVTVWAVLAPSPETSGEPGDPEGAGVGGTAVAFGGAFAGVDLLAELDEPA
ncbi:ATP-binding protein [Streptomyces oceani]|uniref:ATP-binding protein n=1 Tax=Streptomyces oceani TaxID=1075402 RepID=UPI0030B8175E